MACGPWRLYYSVYESRVEIQSVGKGYADELLSTYAEVQDREAQIAFARQAF